MSDVKKHGHGETIQEAVDKIQGHAVHAWTVCDERGELAVVTSANVQRAE